MEKREDDLVLTIRTQLFPFSPFSIYDQGRGGESKNVYDGQTAYLLLLLRILLLLLLLYFN